MTQIEEEKNKAKNSSMAEDEEEMERLGNEMEKMKTNKNVQKSGHTPDPVQHKDK